MEMSEISGSSVTAAHAVEALQQFVVFQTPPPSLAEYATIEPFVVVVGSTTIALMRREDRHQRGARRRKRSIPLSSPLVRPKGTSGEMEGDQVHPARAVPAP